ncbi:phosphoribosyl-AMP cyclohydrolase [bacterium]|nr:phosphoribosyl-AMP cyclohydrolase [bacterium]
MTTPESHPEPDGLFEAIRFDAAGLIPAIVQDAGTGQVLMMAWMDRSAVEKTLETGETWFWSRSRKASWHKGGTSGHVQKVESIRLDCDGDTLLILARQVGGACHDGYFSCFSREADENRQWKRIASPVFDASKVYGG